MAQTFQDLIDISKLSVHQRDEAWLKFPVKELVDIESTPYTGRESIIEISENSGIELSLLSQEDLKHSASDTLPLLHLNTLYMSQGFHIELKQTIQEPITITLKAPKDAKGQCVFPRLKISTAEGVEATFNLEVHNEGAAILLPFIDFSINERAEINWIHTIGTDQLVVLNNMYAEVLKEAKLNVYGFNSKGNLTRHDGLFELKGAQAEVHLKNISLLDHSEKFYNFNTIQHIVGETFSSQRHKVILSDEAFTEFCGLVQVHPGAHEVESTQLNQNLLLSDQAKVFARPQLIIDADDVVCNHGSTTGKLNPDEVFYIQSRGMNYKKAQSLLLTGFAKELIDLIPVPTIRRKFETLLDEEIGYYVNLA